MRRSYLCVLGDDGFVVLYDGLVLCGRDLGGELGIGFLLSLNSPPDPPLG